MYEGARFTVEQTRRFQAWLDDLRDPLGRLAITRRLRRFENGQFGDAKSVGGGVSEARLHVGPGYRLYYLRRGGRVVLLLCGGDKASQARDIAAAQHMAGDLP